MSGKMIDKKPKMTKKKKETAKPKSARPTIGLALGGGGARGLAHILVLEALDEFDVKPDLISGTSIGAILGAAYASGMSGMQIRAHCEELFLKKSNLVRKMMSKWHGSRTQIWNPFSPAIFNMETILGTLMSDGLAKDFEDLKIPFIAVTTNYHTQLQRDVTSGRLLPAIAASAALPALLEPVVIDGHVLIDGGFVNPLPFESLKGKTDISLAIDVNGEPRGDGQSVPGSVEALIGTSQIIMRSIVREKLRDHQPDILISPPVGRFKVLDFFKMEEVLQRCDTLKDDVKRELEAAMESQKVDI
ncbi:MAG: patatin-like phospholipase family protein [bacterium]|nr:patatin-like phospholipase family protein [bacterium]